MSIRDDILVDYAVLLDIGWLKADDEGNVSVIMGDEVFPATIDGKRLVMPTREQMKDRDWSHRIGFHPIREAFNEGVSDVLANLRDQFVQRLNLSTAYLMKELIHIGYDVSNQKNLTSEQSQVLAALTHCNENTVKTFESLQKKTRASNSADQFINIFIRKGGTVKGNAFSRAAIVSFPLYQKLLSDEEKINGVKVSKKDREMLIKLHQFIFPKIDEKEAYNVGVSSKTAPFMESMVRSTINVANDIIGTSEYFMSIVDMPYILTFPEGMNKWIDIFDDPSIVQKMADSIPKLNNGAPIEDYKDEEKPVREEKKVVEERVREEAEVVPERKPSGIRTFGAPPPAKTPLTNKPKVNRQDEIDRENARIRREEAERERAKRQRMEEEDRIARQKRRDEEDRIARDRRDREEERQRERDRDRQRERDRQDDRDRDRDYSRRDSRDDYDDRDRQRNSDDPFESNPVLRRALRDEDRGGRYRYDTRDEGRRGRSRDLRDRYVRDSGRRDYRDDYDDRDYRDDYHRPYRR